MVISSSGALRFLHHLELLWTVVLCDCSHLSLCFFVTTCTGSSDGQVVNNAACQTMTTPKSQNSQEYVSFVSSLLIVQTYIATLYLRQKCTITGELFSESLQRRIVHNNSSRFVCSRIFRAFELELSTSMLALREV
jgi:hypothetical protein